MRLQKLFLLFLSIFFFSFISRAVAISPLDLNENGINDAGEAEVVVSSNISLPAGEYIFNNLIITNNAVLTLEGDSLSTNSFKGVKITAVNLQVDYGSSISADNKGYLSATGPGAPTSYLAGASYGGIGSGGDATLLYGSAMRPTDLGSGGNGNPNFSQGGGAIQLFVSDSLTNNGAISANSNATGSGGSIYVKTNILKGIGEFTSSGGRAYCPNICFGPGGGGRIAIHYQNSSFSGTAIAKGWNQFGGSSEDGTVGFFDITQNNLNILNSSWQFRNIDEPFNFNQIIFKEAKVTSSNDIQITANNLLVDQMSSFTLSSNQNLSIPIITIDGNSTFVLSDGEIFNTNSILVTGNSTITVLPEKILSLTIPNITIDSGSQISVNGQGYLGGPGASSTLNIGASYGGVGAGNTPGTTYGSALTPTEFGSGVASSFRGGGAIHLIVNGILKNDGIISADGVYYGSSGGSIYITTNNIIGDGTIRANGGQVGWPYSNSGGGGRVAVYYTSSSFSGAISAEGGMYCFYGCSPTGESGTAGLFDVSNNTLTVSSSWRFQKNDEPIKFNHIILNNHSKIVADEGANVVADSLLIDDGSFFNLSKNEILNIPNIIIDGASNFILSGEETINTNTLLVTGNSTITVLPEKILSLTIPNITIDSGSQISVNGKGYLIGPGSPETYYEAGASYGGVGGGATAKPVYGSDTAPIDFGSGTEGNRGGGAIRLLIDDTLQNDGIISANGNSDRVSGGSIYINANKIKGNGTFQVNGGNSGWPYGPIGGGGGRVAIYFQESSFTGTATALAGVYCFYGCAPAGGAGTVVMEPSVPVCTIDCFSNVLFLPGLMGSRLYEEGLDCGPDITGPGCGDQQLWVSTSGPDQAKLALDNLGKSINNLFTKDDTQNNGEEEKGIIDEIFGANIYNSFIDDLRNWKQDGTIVDYAFIPYDWRLSLNDIITNGATATNNNLAYTNSQNFSESFILKKLEALQSNSKSGKVTIIAHSNGGLVAKAFIQKLKDTNNTLYDKIDKVIFVAVPQVGTPDAVVALLHGAEIGPAGFIMSNERSRQLSENMPTIYNLLPSASYFTTVDPSFAVDKLVSFENKPFFDSQTSQYGIYVSNETELENYVLGIDGRTKPSFGDTVHPNIGNSTLYTQAENVHQILDSWFPSPDPEDIKVIQVAGWGEETLAGLDYKSYLNSSGSEYLSYKPRKVVDGDGVVVVPSALWMSDTNPNVERWWVDLETYNKPILGINREHRDILEIPNFLDFIKSKIIDSIFTDSENIIVDNTSTLISSDARLHYTLHSPLTLGILDAQGRYTGQDPVTKEIREEIPNVTYEQIGDVQFISAPAGITYTLKIQGYQPGSFSLDVDKQEGNTITASTSFQGIPSSVSTLATMDITPSFEVLNATLQIDDTIDKTLRATPDGTTIYDANPSELKVTFDTNSRDVIFSAQDLSDPHPMIITTNTSITLKDNSDNTTVIPFTKYKEKPTRLRFSYNKIIRNGVTNTLPNTNIVYDWQEKKGVLTDLDTKVTIKGVEKYVFNYKKANNATIIKEKTNSGTITKTKPGFVVVTIKTEGDGVRVNY